MNDYIRAMRAKIGQDRLMLVGASVIVHRAGQILLQQRRDTGTWAEHGGCVEIGEAVEDAARRELREETGLIAGNLSLLGVFSGEDMLFTYPNGDAVYTVIIAYVCEDFSGTPLSETDETTALRWFPLDALPDNITGPSRRIIETFARKSR